MKTTTEYWRKWWNEYALRSGGDYVTDRGTTLRIDELEARAAKQFLDAVSPKLTDVVLDAGCGTGVNFEPLHGRVAEIVALDISEEMLARAEQRISAEGMGNIRLVHGSVTDMVFSSGTFDTVICTSVLQYLNDSECEAALREMIRVCKDGGTLIIHLKNRTSLYGISLACMKLLARMLRRRTIPDYYRPRAWYERIITKFGGRTVDYDSFGIITLVKIPQSVLRHLLLWEMRLITWRRLRKYGVNYKMTVRVRKGTAS